MPRSPRKRTFAVTSANDKDPVNDAGSLRARRQRTGSTSSIEPRPYPKVKLKSSLTGVDPAPNAIAKKGAAPAKKTPVASNVLQSSGIPRPVARDKATRPIKVPGKTQPKTSVTVAGPPSCLSATAKLPGPLPRSLNYKENAKERENHESVGFEMDSLPSIPSPPESPPAYDAMATNNNLRDILPELKALIRAIPPGKKAVSFPTLAARTEPLQVLCPNTSFSSQAVQRPPPAQQRPQKRQKKEPTKEFLIQPETKPPAAKTDEYGCAHLAASDCQLFVSFTYTPHYEVWDMTDDTMVACPALIYVMTKEPHQWDGVPLSVPDVALINIECRTKSGASRFSDHNHDDQWACRFEGVEIPSTDGLHGPAPIIPPDTISIETKWERVYVAPTIGKGCGATNTGNTSISTATQPQRPRNSTGPVPASLTSLLFSTPGSTDEQQQQQEGEGRPPARAKIPGRGWSLRFWIPVPTHLFVKKETRVFDISAKVWIAPGANDKQPFEFSLDSDHISGSTEMTVSHLRKEREMTMAANL